jgi:uncharacterized membrane protein
VATPRLTWFNFAHLFSASLIPFTTEWVADSRLAAAPVSMYAAVFVLVNSTYVALCWEVIDRPAHPDVTDSARRRLHMRSRISIGVFAVAAVIALWWPAAALASLFAYVRPDMPAKVD